MRISPIFLRQIMIFEVKKRVLLTFYVTFIFWKYPYPYSTPSFGYRHFRRCAENAKNAVMEAEFPNRVFQSS
jgi:hypothetical protein